MVNVFCIIVMAALLVAIGAIFYGCRMLLLSIFERYAGWRVSYLSFAHFFAYLIFFLSVDLLRMFATDHILRFLVFLQNPPSDE